MARIFVLEEDRSMREMLKEVLEKKGYNVRVFSAPRELFSGLSCGPRPNLIISNFFGLEEMDGLEVVRRLKNRNSFFRKIPVLLISMFAGSPEFQEKAREAGAEMVLPKPFSIEKQLLPAIAELVV